MNLQHLFTPFRFIEVGLYLAIIYKVNRKYHHISLKNRPLSHRLYIIGLSGWMFYILINIFVYWIAPLSFSLDSSFPQYGYSKTNISLLIANILRDFAIAMGLLECWSYFFLPFVIFYGEKEFIKRLHFKFWFLIIIGTSTPLII